MNVTPINPQPQLSDFERFWRTYPKKVGRPIAQFKFEAITNGGLKTRTFDKDSNSFVNIELHATADEIISGAQKYRESQLKQGSGEFGFKDNGRFIQHPSTWLNQGRWMDE